MTGTRVARAQPTEKTLPDTYNKRGTQGNSYHDPAFFRHLADLPAAGQRIKQYERTGKPEALLTPDIRKKLDEATGDTIDIQIQTTGRRSQVQSTGQFNRTIHGWTARGDEVQKLAEFGDVNQTPKVASTNVGMSDVKIEDISTIAELPFVLEIGSNPRIKIRNSGNTKRQNTHSLSPLYGPATTSTAPAAEDLKADSHSAFDSVFDSLEVKVGCLVNGYDTISAETYYDTNWGEIVGLDKSLAKDFTGAGDWKASVHHGTDVINTAAFMLDAFDSNNSHIVPLRVYDGDTYTDASDFANAIDYMITHDIPAGVCSLVITSNVSYCPSSVCAELDSYVDAGYALAVASGTQNIVGEVDDPAGSYHTIGVGSYADPCSGGYDYRNNTQYAYVDYYDSSYDATYCSWCREDAGSSKFCPDVYACGEFWPTTDKDNTRLNGTSFSAPIVAAGTTLHASVNGPTDYSTHLDKYHNMSNHIICQDSPSKLGQVLHVPDLM